jgi:hypothetical protein
LLGRTGKPGREENHWLDFSRYRYYEGHSWACINSPTWLISASPRATTAATGSPDGGPRTFRFLSAACRRAVVISSVQTVGNQRDSDGTAQDQFREKHVTQVTGERLSELP